MLPDHDYKVSASSIHSSLFCTANGLWHICELVIIRLEIIVTTLDFNRIKKIKKYSLQEAFTRAFVLHYARISRLLMRSADADTLSNRVVHVSVQLFSNEELASKMAKDLHLLHVMVVSLRDMMSKILVPSILQGISVGNSHRTVVLPTRRL